MSVFATKFLNIPENAEGLNQIIKLLAGMRLISTQSTVRRQKQEERQSRSSVNELMREHEKQLLEVRAEEKNKQDEAISRIERNYKSEIEDLRKRLMEAESKKVAESKKD